jgi:CTP synthase (UTP-ammonia lyase)
MGGSLKIAIIGDYNFTYNSHHATNLSLDHASNFLELEVNYYWIKVNEAIQHKPIYFDQFDGIWIAPGPFQNPFYLNGIFKLMIEPKIPVLITGEAFKNMIEFIIALNQLNPFSEKLISENLVAGNSFERVNITPLSKEFEKLYGNFSTIELTSSRFSLYPQLIEQLKSKFIDIEAVNQFDDPEIISLVDHNFFVACSFCPQISSTRDIPHPLIYTFLKAAQEVQVLNA